MGEDVGSGTADRADDDVRLRQKRTLPPWRRSLPLSKEGPAAPRYAVSIAARNSEANKTG
jgi:hypothetical protein